MRFARRGELKKDSHGAVTFFPDSLTQSGVSDFAASTSSCGLSLGVQSRGDQLVVNR